jgi:hypothetical protein
MIEKRERLRRVVLAGLCFVILMAPRSGQAHEKTVLQWRFDKAGDFHGWQPNGEVADALVRGSSLHGRAVGNDPILLGPVFEIPAEPAQRVEICLKGTAAAMAELFWTETLEGQYGGFSESKHRAFHTQGDGKYHVYRIWPFWHAAKKIVRLRVDPPDAGTFDIRWIRIVQSETAGASPAKSWNQREIGELWQPSGDVEERSQGPILLSPRVSLSAAENTFVCVRLSTRQGGSGRLFCVSRGNMGWESVSFPLRHDGKVHSYNLAAGALKSWRDEIIFLGLQVPSAAETRIESIEVARQPCGPAELDMVYFGPSTGINRAGRPATIVCRMRNLGGEPAENVTALLDSPAGMRVTGGAEKHIARLPPGSGETIEWQVQAETPGKFDLGATVAASRVAAVQATAAVRLTRVPGVSWTGYVPEPRPVRSKYDIGAFYFPGFPTASKWRPIVDYPCRKPVLGWYDESNPECADWQIKWAVEHGIKFFMVDWYWCQGHRSLEHWVNSAYGKAKYRKYLQWAIMWANHNPPHTHSADDWRRLTQYWIDHCFNMPEYYRIDNRPAVFIWAPQNVRSDLGGSGEAARLYAMSQQMAQAAGYPGIYFLAMSSHETAEQAKELVREGYRGMTTYHGFQLAWQRAGGDYFPYAALLDTCPEVWQAADRRAGGLLYLPIVDTGWDARPWHGERSLVVSGRTPELFGKLCRQARQFADATGKRIIAIGPMNEWGEGSYIEPYAEYGFEDLDQLRQAFCEPGNWPPNVIPADVGLGPYDLPSVAARTAN